MGNFRVLRGSCWTDLKIEKVLINLFFVPEIPVGIPTERDSSARGEMNVLTLPSERFPRRASDGCASIGQYRGNSAEDDDSSACSATQIKAIQQEYQALQVFLRKFYENDKVFLINFLFFC